MLPTAICTGWPVNSTWRHAGMLWNGQFFFSCPTSSAGSKAFTSGGVGEGLGVGVGVACPMAAAAIYKNKIYTIFRTCFPLTCVLSRLCDPYVILPPASSWLCVICRQFSLFLL